MVAERGLTSRSVRGRPSFLEPPRAPTTAPEMRMDKHTPEGMVKTGVRHRSWRWNHIVCGAQRLPAIFTPGAVAPVAFEWLVSPFGSVESLLKQRALSRPFPLTLQLYYRLHAEGIELCCTLTVQQTNRQMTGDSSTVQLC